MHRRQIRRSVAAGERAFLTVQQAAAELRSREGLAYCVPNECVASSEGSPIPGVCLGRRLLVLRDGLSRLAEATVRSRL